MQKDHHVCRVTGERTEWKELLNMGWGGGATERGDGTDKHSQSAT